MLITQNIQLKQAYQVKLGRPLLNREAFTDLTHSAASNSLYLSLGGIHKCLPLRLTILISRHFKPVI
jgi:hypothetical protein